MNWGAFSRAVDLLSIKLVSVLVYTQSTKFELTFTSLPLNLGMTRWSVC